jgi:hypothetical protein
MWWWKPFAPSLQKPDFERFLPTIQLGIDRETHAAGLVWVLVGPAMQNPRRAGLSWISRRLLLAILVLKNSAT